MHRAIRLFLMAALLVVAVLSVQASPTTSAPAVQITLPGTNTPPPLSFATNTPSGPTSTFTPLPPTATNTETFTPTLTHTPTITPSATFTPTFTYTPTNTPTYTPTFTPTFTPSPTPVGPYSYPEGVSPLTGLPYPNEEARNRRNLIVKISNYPPLVRPQSGINQADVVYEYEVEGGVTRFAAIYRNNTPDHVGPVRSGRLVDLELVPMYQALFAYSGASEPVQNMLMDQEWALQIISPSIGDNCEEAGFCRFPQDGIPFEHTLYLDTNVLYDRATRRGVNTGYRARGFAFSEILSPGGNPATDVFVDYYGQTDARWQYREDSNTYVRYTDSAPHFDAADGEQLWADNLIIIEVPHEERPDLFEPESRSASHQINLWDTGRAYLFRDGVYYDCYWRRRDREPGSALEIIFGDGTPVMMSPGRTWVMITRWMNYVTISTEQPNVEATATIIALTPTNTPWPTPVPETATPGS
ncbi:MAG: DUF3048 domain-containing protein [Anaerolinea sp.]|nr:DUF3048 domain-containing protein [Anaerolinea sp.]